MAMYVEMYQMVIFPYFAAGKKKISKEKMAEIQAKIDADRRALESKKDMAEEERNKVKEDLDKKEKELKKYKWVSAWHANGTYRLRVVAIFVSFWLVHFKSVLFIFLFFWRRTVVHVVVFGCHSYLLWLLAIQSWKWQITLIFAVLFRRTDHST